MTQYTQESKKRHIVGLVAVLGIFAYFIYHIIEGDRGVLSWMRLQEKHAAATAKLTKLNKRRDNLALRVKLLRPNSLDLDLLEEQVRKVLNYTHEDDIIVLHK